jgi:gluconokinase
MAQQRTIDKPTVIIVMGVSGAGKTTIGNLLAAELGWQFRDADDYHSQANKAKMHQGVALTDEDRRPWLEDLSQNIAAWVASGDKTVLACSALKESYRTILRGDKKEIAVVYLRADFEAIAARLATRTDHFMNQDLLQSQFATMEEPVRKPARQENAGTRQYDEADKAHNRGDVLNQAFVVDTTEKPTTIVAKVRREFGL